MRLRAFVDVCRSMPKAATIGAVFAFATVAAAACGVRGSSNDIEVEGNTDSGSVSTSNSPISTQPHDSSAATAASVGATDPVISLERQTCYGRCPAYLVELFADGTVRFEGRQHVPVAGVQLARIDAADVRLLQQRFENSGFASADSSYAQEVANCGQYFADGPQLTLSALIGARRKQVHLDSGCTAAPRFLTTLAAAVDSVARIHTWIPSEGASR